MTTTHYDAKAFGWLKLELNDKDKVTGAVFVKRPGKNTTIPKSLKAALDAYVKTGQNLPKRLYQFPSTGTEFQQAIWQAIAAVPSGQTITYTELAQAVDRPKAARTAGTACGKNPLALFIPCHRVVRAQGEDFGYSWGPDRKRALLQHEGAL